MAPKRPLGNPPPASSSDDDEEEEDPPEEIIGAQKQEDEVEEEEEDDEEEEEEEDEEDEETPAKETAAPPQAHRSKDPPGSSLDSDDTLPNASDFTIKPIVRKRVEDAVKPKKQTPPAPTTLPSKTNSKRPAETPTPVTPETGKKRKKTTPASGGGDDTGRKGIFQRIWSEEDEIAILEGMIKFQSEKGANPITELADFNEFIKGSIHIQASLDQLLSKIKKMKKKYQNKAKKCPNGDDPVFSKPLDHKSFQLSKLIWGAVESNGTVVDGAGKTNKKNKNGGKLKEEQSLEIKTMLITKVHSDEDGFWSAYPCLKKSIQFMPENLRGHMKDNMSLAQESLLKELEDRWRKMNVDEFELYLTRTKLFLDMSQALGYGQGI